MFFFFCFLTNIIVTSMLILGGASVMNALTGMDIYAVRALGPRARRRGAAGRLLLRSHACVSGMHACDPWRRAPEAGSRRRGAQAAFLIPAGIILYTVAGGLKATFIASYVHTVIIYVALCIFSFSVYATCPQLGSPGVVRPRVRSSRACRA